MLRLRAETRARVRWRLCGKKCFKKEKVAFGRVGTRARVDGGASVRPLLMCYGEDDDRKVTTYRSLASYHQTVLYSRVHSMEMSDKSKT